MTEQTKKVATKLNPRLHAEFIRATRLNSETMNSALCRLANRYTEETKSELLKQAEKGKKKQ